MSQNREWLLIRATAQQLQRAGTAPPWLDLLKVCSSSAQSLKAKRQRKAELDKPHLFQNMPLIRNLLCRRRKIHRWCCSHFHVVPLGLQGSQSK